MIGDDLEQNKRPARQPSPTPRRTRPFPAPARLFRKSCKLWATPGPNQNPPKTPKPQSRQPSRDFAYHLLRRSIALRDYERQLTHLVQPCKPLLLVRSGHTHVADCRIAQTEKVSRRYEASFRTIAVAPPGCEVHLSRCARGGRQILAGIRGGAMSRRSIVVGGHELNALGTGAAAIFIRTEDPNST